MTKEVSHEYTALHTIKLYKIINLSFIDHFWYELSLQNYFFLFDHYHRRKLLLSPLLQIGKVKGFHELLKSDSVPESEAHAFKTKF